MGKHWELRQLGLLGLVSVLSFQAAWPWGRSGHEIVALVAEERLNPSTRKALDGILGPGVSLDRIANCADYIRREQLLAFSNFDELLAVNCGGAFPIDPHPGSGPWHFIDIPTYANPTESSLGAYCPGGQCVLEQVKEWSKALHNPAASRYQRQIALMFVVHFTGDLHQPLHCASEYNPDGTHDRGGNEKKVRFLGKTMKLHQVWDGIVETKKDLDRLDSKKAAQRLASQVTESEAKSWLKGNFAAKAALESFLAAQKMIYPEYHENGPNLGQDYQNRMRPIAYERLKMAGVRLAELLERALTNSAESQSFSPRVSPSR